MVNRQSVFTLTRNSDSNGCEFLFGSSNTQKLVKDEVAFAPTPESYQYLQIAAERFQAGKSVFFNTIEEAEKVLAEAKHA